MNQSSDLSRHHTLHTKIFILCQHARDGILKSRHNVTVLSTPSKNKPVLLPDSSRFTSALVNSGRERVCDHLALVTLAVAAFIAIMTFRDYGLGWDDYAHSEY